VAGNGLTKTDTNNGLTRTISVAAADTSISVTSSGIKVNAGDNLEIDSSVKTLRVKTAQTGVTGAVKVTAVNSGVTFTGATTAPSAAPQESIKCYGLQLDKNGTAFVHVPWTDSQTLVQTITQNKNTDSSTYATVGYKVSGDTEKTFNIKGAGSAKVTASGTDITITADTNTWRAINAYKCEANDKSLILESTGTASLTFSRDFCWHNDEITICWAEISENGTVTYK
jgi:hypothetical protein